MQIQTDAVTVLGTGLWDEEHPEYGLYLAFKDNDGHSRRWSLDAKVNGSTPAEGERVALVVRMGQRAEAKLSANGTPYIHRRDKFKVVGVADAA